jgi:hypothetical protein
MEYSSTSLETFGKSQLPDQSASTPLWDLRTPPSRDLGTLTPQILIL